MPACTRRRRELPLQGIEALAELALILRYFGKQASGFRCFLGGHAPMVVETYRVVAHSITMRRTCRFSGDNASSADALFCEALRPQPCQLPRSLYPIVNFLKTSKSADNARLLPRAMRLDLPFIVREASGAEINANLFAHAALWQRFGMRTSAILRRRNA